ncbi:MAG: alkaline phosphatase, partial [Planctomycetota bacterium]|nr:alkaline phosphatase [Planctomycetota bacterium]
MRTKTAALFVTSVFLAALFALLRAEDKQEPAGGGGTAAGPKNVIFLIGDGMGVGQLTLARLVGPGHDGNLAMDTMPVLGLARTHSANAFVCDSAAAGTALATGEKTNNKM